MRWAKLLGLAALAEVALIASAVVFMLIYSSAVHPGETPEFYRLQARALVPYVAIAVSFPLFYWMSKWTGGWRFALVFFAAHLAMDIAISLASDGLHGITAILPLWLTSQAAKLLGCWFGSRDLQH